MADLAVWEEWERASRGRRQLTWSRSMRTLADLADERTDEENAAEEVGSAADGLVLLPWDTWRAVRPAATHILDFTVIGGVPL